MIVTGAESYILDTLSLDCLSSIKKKTVGCVRLTSKGRLRLLLVNSVGYAKFLNENQVVSLCTISTH